MLVLAPGSGPGHFKFLVSVCLSAQRALLLYSSTEWGAESLSKATNHRQWLESELPNRNICPQIQPAASSLNYFTSESEGGWKWGVRRSHSVLLGFSTQGDVNRT